MTVRLTASSKAVASLGFVLTFGIPAAATADHVPDNLPFETLITTPLVVEGLTGDRFGNLYTPGRQPGVGNPCPIWRVNRENPSLVPVGFIPAPDSGQCSPSGLTFDQKGDLFVSEGDKVFTFTPNSENPPEADVYATGVPGTNGVAFDRHGNLWTGDGTTGQGRVWKVPPGGGEGIEVFRVQPMANEVNLVNGVGGVGRDVRTLPPGTITVTPTSRNAANTAGSQPLVANGLIFNQRGDLFIADTARGAIWRVQFDPHGNLRSNQVGCDTTFTDNTLCLDNVLVTHPYLEGADGIDLDRSGNIWVSVNERNSMVVVTRTGEVIEVFRNEPNAITQLRNDGVLEFPTSPFVLDRHVCTANSDGGRRDNAPNSAGEIKPAGPDRGKVSCASLRH